MNDKLKNILTVKIGLTCEQADWAINISEKHAIWIANQIKKYPILFPDRINKIRRIFEWKKQYPEIDITQHCYKSINKVIAQTKKEWFIVKPNSFKNKTIFASCGHKPFKWVALTRQWHLKEEGEYMGNCLKDYELCRSIRIFSLRDKYNIPVLTIEYHKEGKSLIISQYYERFNEIPSREHDYLFEYLEKKFKQKVSAFSKYQQGFNVRLNNLTAYSSEVVEHLHHLDNNEEKLILPENLTVLDSLNLYKISSCLRDKLSTLPKGLVVKGNLNISDTCIKVIPKGTVIKGDLNIRNCQFMEEIDIKSFKLKGKILI